MRWRVPWRRFIDAADMVGLVALQEPREERRFFANGRGIWRGDDYVGCEGTADVSMVAWMFDAGHWLLVWWLCAVVGGVRRRWMRLLGQVLGVLSVGRRIRRRSRGGRMQRRCRMESGCSRARARDADASRLGPQRLMAPATRRMQW